MPISSAERGARVRMIAKTSKVTMAIPLNGSPSLPFIVTRKDGVHAQGIVKVVVFPQTAGVQWSNTVGSTLWVMASGVVVVLGIVLGLAEIAPASCQPQQAAWSSLQGVRSSGCVVVAFRGPCRPRSCIHMCASGSGARGGPKPPWAEC